MHVEAMLWTIVISGIAHCIPFGIKVLLSGGGYGKPLGLIMSNSGMGEGSTLALIAICLIPLCLYLFKHQTLIPYKRLAKLMLAGFIAMALLASIGTYARTGLVALLVLGLLLITRSNSKTLYLTLVIVTVAVISYIASDTWVGRMVTIGDDTEGSAMGRVAVWLWTIEYVLSNPLGGSFEVYRISEASFVASDGTVIMALGKAFHSIYFEVLGETGIPGFVIYLLIIFFCRGVFVRIVKRAAIAEDAWITDAARYLLFSLYIFLAGGAFIGIGFQSFFYYIVALSVALINLSDRMQDR
jgi:probable O-glycosylation ligase (exosortase A-associated)